LQLHANSSARCRTAARSERFSRPPPNGKQRVGCRASAALAFASGPAPASGQRFGGGAGVSFLAHWARGSAAESSSHSAPRLSNSHNYRADRLPCHRFAVRRDHLAGNRRGHSTVALSVIMSARSGLPRPVADLSLCQRRFRPRRCPRRRRELEDVLAHGQPSITRFEAAPTRLGPGK
jgi:hypothetical protein